MWQFIEEKVRSATLTVSLTVVSQGALLSASEGAMRYKDAIKMMAFSDSRCSLLVFFC